MKEYIERESLLKEEQEIYHWNGTDDIYGNFISSEIVRAFPAADVAPVVHGRWYDEDSFDAHGSPIYRCSVCNKTVADNYILCHKFCLHCGTRMDGGNSNE